MSFGIRTQVFVFMAQALHPLSCLPAHLAQCLVQSIGSPKSLLAVPHNNINFDLSTLHMASRSQACSIASVALP